MVLHHLRKRLLISYGVIVLLLTLSFFSYLYVTASQQRQIAAQENLELLNQSIHVMLKETFENRQPLPHDSSTKPSTILTATSLANINMEVVDVVTTFIQSLALDYPISLFLYDVDHAEKYRVTIAPVDQPENSLFSLNKIVYLKSALTFRF